MDCARGHLMPRMKPWKRRDQFLSLQRLFHGQRPSCMFRNGRSESSPCSKGEATSVDGANTAHIPSTSATTEQFMCILLCPFRH